MTTGALTDGKRLARGRSSTATLQRGKVAPRAAMGERETSWPVCSGALSSCAYTGPWGRCRTSQCEARRGGLTSPAWGAAVTGIGRNAQEAAVWRCTGKRAGGRAATRSRDGFV